MDNSPINLQGGSAAAPKDTYSAQELAEVYMTSREDFLGLDMEETTCNWNVNYIYDFLYYIKNVDLFDDIIEWLVECWKSKHMFYSSYENVANMELVQACSTFEAQLKFIKVKLLERFQSERHTEELRAKMLEGYKRNSVSTCPNQAAVEPKIETSTNQPTFASQSDMADKYHVELESLPESVRGKVLLSQNVFNVFVKQLNEDIWLTVNKEKTKLCGCLFFLCNFHGITARNTDAREFDTLLHHIISALEGQGSVLSSIRRREETNKHNIKRSYLCYENADINKSMENEIYKLRNDCSGLLDGLAPVLKAMEEERRKEKMSSSQALQASSVA